MNHLYRSLWNDVTRTFVAVAEVARGRGKRSSDSRMAGTGDAAVAPPVSLLRPLALEPRLMFDAAAVATVVEAVRADAPVVAEASHAATLVEAAQHLAQLAPAAVETSRHEVAFIDTGMLDWQSLRDGLPEGVEVVLLDGNRDGLSQMVEYLQGRTGLDAIHILSHGAQGQVRLGAFTLESAAIASRAADLTRLGASLGADGDILIYGCDVAAGDGQALVEQLAAATGADVAASTDGTGNAALQGDWDLEVRHGPVEAAAFSLPDYQGRLAAFTDTYTSNFGSNVTSFTSTLSGVSFTYTFTGDGDGGNFAWDNMSIPGQEYLNANSFNAGNTGTVERFTITRTDAGDFTLGSIYVDNLAGTATVTVRGYLNGSAVGSAQTMSGGSTGTLSFGSIRVDEVRATAPDFAFVLFDNFSGDTNPPNAAPVATASGGTTAFSEGNNVTSTPVVIDSSFTATDGDNTTLASAIVAITGNLQTSQDVLAFTNNPATMGNITGSYTAGTGILSLSSAGATATLAQWQAALRSVTYSNSSDTPNTSNRTVSFTLNDGTADGNTATKVVTISSVNDTPIATASGGTTAFTEGASVTSTPVVIDSGLTVSDVDSSTLAAATVSITGNLRTTEDVLAFTNNPATMGNITGSYTAGTGVLFLNSAGATATLAQWQAALRSVTYTNSSDAPDTSNRTISFAVHDGSTSSSATTKVVTVASANDSPVVGNLGGDSVAWAGVGNTVVLDSSANATLSDPEFAALNSGNGDWAGGSLTVSRTGSAVSADVFGFNLSGASFTVSGSNLQSGGLTFATFTNTGGVLAVTFTGSGTAATTALAQDVARRISYRNDTPAGDATIRFTFSDGSASSTADVTVTSDTIYVTNATDTATIDASDGVSFSEAVAIAAADAAGSQTLVLTNALAGTVTLAGNLAINESLTVNADAVGNLTLSGSTITLGGGTTLGFTQASGSATLASTLAGSGALSKAGAATLTLSSASNSAGWSGGVTVSAGALSIASDSRVTSGTLTLDGGQLTLAGFGGGTLDNAIVLGASGGTVNASSSAAVASGAITGSGSLAKTGGQLLTLTGTNTYSGGTAISGANGLAVNDASNLGSGAVTLNTRLQVLNATTLANNLVLGNTGTATIVTDSNVTLSGTVSGADLTKLGSARLTLSGSNTYTGTTTVSAGSLQVAGDANLGAGALTLDNAELRISAAANIDNAITLSNVAAIYVDGADATLSGVVSGSGTLQKTGANTLTLSGSNTHSGSVDVTAGGLTLQGGASLGDSSAVTVSSGATLTLGLGNETIGSLAGSGNVVLGYRLTTGGDNSSTVFSGVISGVGNGLTKTGSGTFTLSGTNSFTGSTLVSAGTLSLSNGAAIADTSAVTVASGATLRLHDSDETLASLAGAGTVTLNGGSLTLSGNASTTFSGVIEEGGLGSQNLVKLGSGTLTLSGANTYSGTTTVLDGTLSVAGDANLGSGAVTLNGGTLSVTGAGTIDNAFSAGVNGATVDNALALQLSGATSGSGTFTKTGSGTLTLSGSSVHSGTVTVSAGTLAASGGAALGDAAAVTVNAGATLALNAAETIGSLAGAGAVTLGANTLTTSGNASTTFSGGISGTGGLAKQGSGTLTLSGTNTYSGSTTLAAGSLTLSGGAALSDSSAVVMSAGTTLNLSASETVGSLSGTGTVALGSNTLTAGGDGSSTSFAGVIGGTGGFTKAGGGTLTLSGINSFSGATTVSAGTLSLSNGSAIADTSAVTVASGATLRLHDSSETLASLAGAGTVTLNGGSLTLSGNASTTFSGVIQDGGLGSQNLVKLGSGTQTLTGANTYSGTTEVLNGTLAVAGDASLGGGAVTLNGGTLSVTGAGTIDNAIVIGPNEGVIDAAAAVTLSGALSGGDTLYVQGSGSLTLSNSGNAGSFSGGTAVLGGTLSVASDAMLGAGTLTLNSGTLTLTAATTIDNALQLSGTGGTVMAGAAATLSGAISGLGDLSKTGSAVLTLGGTGSYTGSTAVQAGSLIVTGALNGTASLTVASGATLAGTGSIGSAGTNGLVIVNAGGTLAPGLGAGSTGTLTLLHGLTMYSGTTLQADVRGSAAGSGYDQLAVTGVVNLNGGTLSLDLGSYTAATGETYRLIDNDGSDAVLQTFAGLAEGASLTAANGRTLGVSYVAGTGNDVVLTALNAAPTVANALAVQAATEDSAFAFTVPANTFADADAGDTLTYSATLADGSALPGWLNFEAATRSFSGTPLNGDVGAITVKVTATDSSNASASSNFTLTVANTNDAPTGTAIAAQAATEDSAFSFTVPANTFADVDVGDTLTYAATLADGSVLPSWLSFDATTRAFSGTPLNGDVGAITVKVTATDGSGASGSSNFTLTVANTNDAPTSTAIATQAATEDAAFSFTVPLNTFADVDVGDTLSYTATLADGSALPSWLSFDAATRTFSGTPANGDVGAVTVKVTATDGSNASASSNFALTVANTNDAPTGTAIAAQAATEDSAFSFTVPANTFADVDVGDTLTYTATLADGAALPAWLSFNAATRSFSGTPLNGDVGAIIVKVTATDASSASVSSNFTLTVTNTNDAPTSTAIAAQAATEDRAFNFQVPANTFADVDVGDTLTYTAMLADGSALPAWLSFNAATRTFSGTPLNGDVGAIAVKVTATDGSDASAASNFTLTVANTNDAPVAAPIAFQPVAEDIAFVFTVPANTFTDVDLGDTLTYTATLANGAALPAWLSFDATTRTFTGTPANGDVGIISVTVTATDASQASASSTFGLFVSNTNDVPTATPIAAQTATEDSAFSFTVPASTFSDVDPGDTLSYTALLADGSPLPVWLSFNTTTCTFAGTPANGDVGTLTVRVQATDASGTSAASSFTLTVANTNDAPTGTAIAAQAATEDSAFSFTVPANTFADVDVGDTLTYTATLANGAALPAWLSFNATTLTFSGTPLNGDVGAIAVKVTATDASNASAASSFTLTVANTNDAPTGAAIAPQSTPDSSAFSFTVPAGTFTDVDAGDVLRYSATQVDGAALPAWLSFDAATRTFSGTPAFANIGAITLRVIATDASGARAVSDFTLTVTLSPPQPLVPVPPAVPDTPAAPTLLAPVVVDVRPVQVPVADFLTAAPSGVVLESVLQPSVATRPDTAAQPAAPLPVAPAPALAPVGAPSATAAGLQMVPQLGTLSLGGSDQRSVEVPLSSFLLSSPAGAVTVEARQANGLPLPAWLRYDPASGKLVGRAPAGLRGVVQVELIARDSQGQRASTRLEIRIGDAPPPAGDTPAPTDRTPAQPERPQSLNRAADAPERLAARPGLSEQLRQARGLQRSALVDRLATAPRADRAGPARG